MLQIDTRSGICIVVQYSDLLSNSPMCRQSLRVSYSFHNESFHNVRKSKNVHSWHSMMDCWYIKRTYLIPNARKSTGSTSRRGERSNRTIANMTSMVLRKDNIFFRVQYLNIELLQPPPAAVSPILDDEFVNVVHATHAASQESEQKRLLSAQSWRFAKESNKRWQLTYPCQDPPSAIVRTHRNRSG